MNDKLGTKKDERRANSTVAWTRAAAFGCRITSILIIGIVLFAAGCGSAPVEPGAPLEAFTGHLDRRVPELMDRYDVPGVNIALVRDGERVWAAAYGKASREHDRAMSVNAIFRAESLSKPVTAWGVLRLVERGQLDLDAPVQQYLQTWELPASEYPESEVTIRRLLSNSAGIGLGTIGEEYPPQADVPSLRTYLSREVRIVHEPGSRFSYSNAGFNLIDLLVEEVDGRDFADYMAAEVLTPLGMERASFVWQDTVASTIATGYDVGGRAVSTYVYPGKASGGLFASVDDIARFVEAGMTGADNSTTSVLNHDKLLRLYEPHVEIPGLYGFVADAYGLGHFIEWLPTGQRAVWHGGQGHGWMTHVHSVPEAGEGIVILTNSQRSWPLMSEVLAAWAGWAGFGSVKMGRIARATTVLWGGIGVLLLLAAWLMYRLVHGMWKGTRTWGPFARTDRGRRLIQAVLGLGGIVLLAWSAAQPYLMVTSIFPGVIDWVGITLLVFSTLLVAFASFPVVEGSTPAKS